MNEAPNNVKEHPLKGYWLVRSAKRDEECDPFRSVMEISAEEAIRRNLDSGKTSNKGFKGYLNERKLVEEWAQSEAMRVGLKPEPPHPIYFTLRKEPMLGAPPKGSLTVNIPAETIPVEKLSLMLGDSFDNYAKLQGRSYSHSPKRTAARAFNAQEIKEMFDKEGFPEELQRASQSHYIECQVWSRDLPCFEDAKAQLRQTPQTVITVSPPAHTKPPPKTKSLLPDLCLAAAVTAIGIGVLTAFTLPLAALAVLGLGSAAALKHQENMADKAETTPENLPNQQQRPSPPKMQDRSQSSKLAPSPLRYREDFVKRFASENAVQASSHNISR